MPQIIIIIIVVAGIIWVVWAVRQHKRVVREAALDQTWREVLDDPHYMERRHYEERMRVEGEARAAAAKRSLSMDSHPRK